MLEKPGFFPVPMTLSALDIVRRTGPESVPCADPRNGTKTILLHEHPNPLPDHFRATLYEQGFTLSS